MRVLVACEFSGIVREAFAKRGHDAWSCDLLDTEIPGQHIKGDVLDILGDDWDLMIAHPTCTYLTNAGVRHLHSIPSRNGVLPAVHGPARWKAMRESAAFFNELQHAPIEKIAVENPVPHRYARAIIGPYTQLIQPWQFGHPESKATCLWLKNLPKLAHTNVLKKPGGSHWMNQTPSGQNKLGPSKDRWKLRSRTFQGIADAMANQWG